MSSTECVVNIIQRSIFPVQWSCIDYRDTQIIVKALPIAESERNCRQAWRKEQVVSYRIAA
jgi:hypothetical protein